MNQKPNMGRRYVNLVTHCAICDCALNEFQGLNPFTHEPDDLCSDCQRSVRYAIVNHDKDKEEMEIMEKFGWRSYVNESSVGEDIDVNYDGDISEY